MIDLSFLNNRVKSRFVLALALGSSIACCVVFALLALIVFPRNQIFSTGAIPILQAYPHGDGQVVLIWSADSTSVGRRVNWQYQHRSDVSRYDDWKTIPDFTNGNSYVVEDLENGRSYTFRVRALLQNDELVSISNEASVTLPLKSYQIENIENILNTTNSTLSQILEEIKKLDIDPKLDDIAVNVKAILNHVLETECAPITICQGVRLGELYFDNDSYSLDIEDELCDCGNGRSNETMLRLIFDALDEQQGEVFVEGYASFRGTSSYNLNLSRKRADHVIQRLLEYNEDWSGRFRAVAKGESYAGSTYCDEACSRRVHVILCQDKLVTPPISGYCGAEQP